MQNLDYILQKVRGLSPAELRSLHEELALIRAAIPHDEAQSAEDISPLDVPIEMAKDSGTGRLKIRFPFYYGARADIGWRTLEITSSAQRALIEILVQSVKEDIAAGRTSVSEPGLQ
jgi:hypothetical protein